MDIALELDRELRAKVDDENSLIKDYELDVEVYFYHTSDDEKYEDPIAQCDYFLKNCSKEGRYQMFCNGEKWNDHAEREGHHLFGEHFCYMFHDLSDHFRKYPPRKHNRDVTLEELLLIDNIWIDVIPKLQTTIEISEAPKTHSLDCITCDKNIFFTANQLEYIGSCGDELVKVKRNGKIGFLNKSLKGVTDFIFDEAGEIGDGLICVSYNQKYGYIDAQGKTIIDFEFDNATSFYGNYAFVLKGQEVFCIDKEGGLYPKHRLPEEVKQLYLTNPSISRMQRQLQIGWNLAEYIYNNIKE
jgi:hypothetical protein